MKLFEERIKSLNLTNEELFEMYNEELLRELLCSRDKETQRKKVAVLSKLVSERK